MSSTYQSYKIFISSPNDVEKERLYAKEVINKISCATKETVGIELEPVDWAGLPPSTTDVPKETIQDRLNKILLKCNMFVLILNKRYGSRESSHKKGNTEREIDIAIELRKKNPSFIILSYFKCLKRNDDTGEQEKAVRLFRDRLRRWGLWVKEFTSPEQFKDAFVYDLYSTVLSCQLSTTKHQALRNFFSFGISDRFVYPRLAIIYPAMERNFMGPIQDDKLWLNRLEPNIVFEDFRALQKLDSCLHYIGFDNFRIYNTYNIPTDIHFMNRIWVCLRNQPGMLQLRHIDNLSKFNVVINRNRRSSFIRWRTSPNRNRYIDIHSPLSDYLKEQRNTICISGEWQAQMSNIIAKDYAVLSRFSLKDSDPHMKDGTIKDYFIFGIRGLGTWGAAWFVDHKYNHLIDYAESEDIQLLLEVEYKNGKIFNVIDVSNKDQKYFNRQNNRDYIKQVVQKHPEF